MDMNDRLTERACRGERAAKCFHCIDLSIRPLRPFATFATFALFDFLLFRSSFFLSRPRDFAQVESLEGTSACSCSRRFTVADPACSGV